YQPPRRRCSAEEFTHGAELRSARQTKHRADRNIDRDEDEPLLQRCGSPGALLRIEMREDYEEYSLNNYAQCGAGKRVWSLTSDVAECPHENSFAHAKSHSDCENVWEPGNQQKVVTVLRIQKHARQGEQERDKRSHNHSLRNKSTESWQLRLLRLRETARQDLAIDVRRSCCCTHVASLSLSFGNASLISLTIRSACLRSGLMNGLLA